jgi:hypothetical protein
MPRSRTSRRRTSDAFTIVRQSDREAYPTSSWWLGLDRASLQVEAARQRPRMRHSKFHRAYAAILKD